MELTLDIQYLENQTSICHVEWWSKLEHSIGLWQCLTQYLSNDPVTQVKHLQI
jgi:hypothetical protein